MNEGSPGPYEVLHPGRASTAHEVVGNAYPALVRAHHTETRPAGTVSADANTEAQVLQEIMDAYAVLGDPARRAAYDRQRQKTRLPPLDRGPSGPDLVIGPLRREHPGSPAPGRRLLWWIQSEHGPGPSSLPRTYRERNPP